MSTQNCPKCFFLNPADAANCGRCGADLRTAGDKGFFPEQTVGGRYRLVRRIGEGGMGEVWEAVQSGTELQVAIKFLHPVLMIHSTARDRVKKEAQALGRLRRFSRVITLYDYFETAHTVALVLEYAQGGSLADLIDSRGALQCVQALDIMDGVFNGLQAIHGEGFVHRDIKPDNVLLVRGESRAYIPKITDLGIVHVMKGTRITAQGSHLGTFEYMAPELFQGQDPSTKSDIYACGVLLYELLVGRPPFGGHQATIVNGHLNGVPDFSSLPTDVPNAVRQALQRALSKSPAERFDDCYSFHRALRATTTGVDAGLEQLSIDVNESGAARPKTDLPKKPETLIQPAAQSRAAEPERADATGQQGSPSVTEGDGRVIDADGSTRMNPQPLQELDARPKIDLESSSGGWAYTWPLIVVLALLGIWFLWPGDGQDNHATPEEIDAVAKAGHLVVTGSFDDKIRLWDGQSGDLLKTLSGHNDAVWSVAISPDGQRIASASGDASIRLWSTRDGRLISVLLGHDERVSDVAFSPDGETLASGSLDGTVRLWMVGDGRPLKTLRGHTQAVTSVAFSPDGRSLVSGSVDTTVQLWRVNDGQRLQSLLGHRSTVWCVAFSPDGGHIVSGSGDNRVEGENIIRLWRVSGGQPVRTLNGHTGAVRSVMFLDEQQIVSGSWDKTVRIWNTANGRLIRIFSGHTDGVMSVSVSPDGHRIASSSLDGTTRVWSRSDGLDLGIFAGYADEVLSVAFAPR